MLHTAEEKFLVQLAKEYPTVAAASSEIINLQAILRLPKPTEHFMSDLHGESDAFTHILGNASGVIKERWTVCWPARCPTPSARSLQR